MTDTTITREHIVDGHPDLERARAEERERCAAWHDEQARVVECGSIFGGLRDGRKHREYAAAIRALGPAPWHTDLMVPPETLDEYMAANPLPEDPLEARIRALETEIARKDAALRQAIDILQVQGFPLMADFCRAALGLDEAQVAVEKHHASE